MFLERTFGSILRSGTNTFREITEATAGATSALSQLNAGVTFLQFTIGDALNTVLEPLLPTIMAIIEGIADFVQQHPDIVLLAVALAAVGAAMVPIGASLVFFQNIGALGGIAGLLGSGGALSTLLTPLGAIALILGGLIVTSKEFQPVAFGLNAIIIKFYIDEAKGWTENHEEQLSSIAGVNSVNVEEVRRAVG